MVKAFCPQQKFVRQNALLSCNELDRHWIWYVRRESFLIEVDAYTADGPEQQSLPDAVFYQDSAYLAVIEVDVIGPLD